MEQENNLDALHEHYSFGADAGQEPLRVDKFLMNRIENATRNKIQQAATRTPRSRFKDHGCAFFQSFWKSMGVCIFQAQLVCFFKSF